MSSVRNKKRNMKRPVPLTLVERVKARSKREKRIKKYEKEKLTKAEQRIVQLTDLQISSTEHHTVLRAMIADRVFF